MFKYSIDFDPTTGHWIVEISTERGSGRGEHWLLFVAGVRAVSNYLTGV